MKPLFNIIFVLGCVFGMNACTKSADDIIANDKGADDLIETKSYTYNTATKQLSPDADIEAKITAQKDISWIYTYLIREGNADSLLDIMYTNELEDKRNLNFSIPGSKFANIQMDDISGLKLMIKRTDNSSSEAFITIQSFTPAIPQWANVPSSLEPDENDIIHVTAMALSENGITKIELYDDYQGTFDKVHEVTLNQETQYNFVYDYTYRPNAANLKLILYDEYGLQAEAVISIPIQPYDIYKDVTMHAQGTTTVTFSNSAIILPEYQLIGPCNFANYETKISFFFYNTSNGPTFYSPTNTGSVIANYRCGGAQYAPAIPVSSWTDTKFRVLDPANTAQNAIYEAYNSNNIADMDDDGLFTGIAAPSSSAPRYGTDSGQFDTANKYLIWAKIPNPDKTINVLLRIKSVSQNSNESSVTFDLLVPKN